MEVPIMEGVTFLDDIVEIVVVSPGSSTSSVAYETASFSPDSITLPFLSLLVVFTLVVIFPSSSVIVVVSVVTSVSPSVCLRVLVLVCFLFGFGILVFLTIFSSSTFLTSLLRYSSTSDVVIIIYSPFSLVD